MYSRLTKTTNVNGTECISCAFYGTEKCNIHKSGDVTGCVTCPVFGAILNQLHEFEDVIEEIKKEDMLKGIEDTVKSIQGELT